MIELQSHSTVSDGQLAPAEVVARAREAGVTTLALTDHDAANQIGVARRIAVFDAHDDLGPRVMINPVIVETEGEVEFEEGCLSVPGHYWEITRPAFARVRALDLEGQEVEYAGDELLGRVMLHEIDHLNGLLLVDAMPKRLRKKALKELREEGLGLG